MDYIFFLPLVEEDLVSVYRSCRNNKPEADSPQVTVIDMWLFGLSDPAWVLIASNYVTGLRDAGVTTLPVGIDVELAQACVRDVYVIWLEWGV